ncbi:hypothetical protein, partial [uncultured Rubinisphaera sp.]|uniref:hypothetical protein n=1 Tax=uncultured Rubinisphaera sp. TaxID=1678686 RepID=UPI0030D982F9
MAPPDVFPELIISIELSSVPPTDELQLPELSPSELVSPISLLDAIVLEELDDDETDNDES